MLRRARYTTICLPVRPSVCPYDTFEVTYADHMEWYTSNIISHPTGLRSWLQHRRSGSAGTPPKLGWNRGVVMTVMRRKPAITLKLGKIEPRFLWRTNSKSHMRFRFEPKSMTLNSLFQNVYLFGDQNKRMKIDAHNERRKYQRTILLPYDELCTARYCDCMSSVRLSVRLSVTLVDQDHTGWKSWKLITRTINAFARRSPKKNIHLHLG